MGFTEENYQKFKEQVFGHLVKMAIGFVLGFIGVAFFEKDPSVVQRISAGMIFAGVPYAWSVIPIHIFPTNLAGLFFLALKGAICFTCGWIITGIGFAYSLIQFIRYDEKLTDERIKAKADSDETREAMVWSEPEQGKTYPCAIGVKFSYSEDGELQITETVYDNNESGTE